jgi:hypothetical protein
MDASKYLENPENWRPRALVWAEAIASETFDFAEKLLVVSAVGAAAAITKSRDAGTATEILTFLLALYITARLDRAAMNVFKGRFFGRTTGFVLYFLAGVGLICLLASIILPALTASTAGLIIAVLK